MAAAMTTTAVTLNAEQTAQVKSYIEEGRFASLNEAVEQLLAWAIEEDQAVPYSSEALSHLSKGMVEADRGEFVPKERVEAFLSDWRRNG